MIGRVHTRPKSGRGGVLVEYANPLSFRRLLRLLASILVLDLLPNGRIVYGYGQVSRCCTEGRFWRTGRPCFGGCGRARFGWSFSGVFSLREAAKANELLESGTVVGNIDLLAPELMQAGVTMDTDDERRVTK
jgi:hypothetical protein